MDPKKGKEELNVGNIIDKLLSVKGYQILYNLGKKSEQKSNYLRMKLYF